MDDIQKHIRLTSAIRWTARVWSIITITLVLAFIIGEGVDISKSIEWIAFLFFPVGICAGMIIAWWKEGPGAFIVIGSLLTFYVIHFITAGTLPKGWAWEAFAFPGFLFGICWFRSRKVLLQDA